MIDYEALELYNAIASHRADVMMNYVTIFFAIVVTSYVAGKKLPSLFIVAILLVYTAFAISVIDGLLEMTLKMDSIQTALGDRVPADYWQKSPFYTLSFLAFPIYFFGSYLAAIGFVLYMKFRKNGN